jgi:single-stranded DNA-binding protein
VAPCEKRYSTEVIANNVVLPGAGRGARSEGGRAESGRPEGAREAGSAGRGVRDTSEPPFDEFAEAGATAGSGGSAGGGDDDIPF